MTNWEYNFIQGTHKQIMETLNRLGSEGWEAVNMVGNAFGLVVLLKRPVA